jgi:hypothetical protein
VIQTCAALNRALGVTTITPWNVGQIPEHEIEMILAAKNLEANLILPKAK